MSGINTVGGLRNVSIDYRPQIGPEVPNVEGAQHTGADEIPEQDDNIIYTGSHPKVADATSMVRQLDTLLLNAAVRSFSADVAAKTTGLTRGSYRC